METAAASTGAYGSYTLSAGGGWTYTLDNANALVQALGAGQTLSDSFIVNTADGTAQQVTITINGATDAVAPPAGGTGSDGESQQVLNMRDAAALGTLGTTGGGLFGNGGGGTGGGTGTGQGSGGTAGSGGGNGLLTFFGVPGSTGTSAAGGVNTGGPQSNPGTTDASDPGGVFVLSVGNNQAGGGSSVGTGGLGGSYSPSAYFIGAFSDNFRQQLPQILLDGSGSGAGAGGGDAGGSGASGGSGSPGTGGGAASPSGETSGGTGAGGDAGSSGSGGGDAGSATVPDQSAVPPQELTSERGRDAFDPVLGAALLAGVLGGGPRIDWSTSAAAGAKSKSGKGRRTKLRHAA